jgi:hypothetical protein
MRVCGRPCHGLGVKFPRHTVPLASGLAGKRIAGKKPAGICLAGKGVMQDTTQLNGLDCINVA